MNLYAFEIVQTVEGQPDPWAYPEGLSHTPQLSGAAKVAYLPFDDDETAQAQAVTHEEGYKSQVWEKYCPPMFKSSDAVGGMDVFYIGPLSDSEVFEVRQAFLRVLWHHERVTPTIFWEMTTEETLRIAQGSPDEPSDRDIGLFSQEVESVVDEYFASLHQSNVHME